MVAEQKNNSTATAVLLAAGSGSRFLGSQHKLLTQILGRSVFAWSVKHLAEARFRNIIIVTGAVDLSSQISGAQISGANLIVAHNKNWQSGMASSLQCGLAEAQRLGADAVVIGLADQPAIVGQSWQRVARSTAPLAVATYSGVRGNPVRVHAELWPLLPTSGDEGARSLFKSHKDLLEEVACDGSSHDLDTNEDIVSLTKLLSQ
ncbi:MAG: nucleotidyltransferase family protein [Actinomycetota bacterium]|nr:nucleotidyltransferase family protein [Actinomycetota bacterium]